MPCSFGVQAVIDDPRVRRYALRMTVAPTQRFPIHFDSWYAALSRTLFIPPTASYVELNADFVVVRMAWAFDAIFPRASVQSITPLASNPVSRGVHGIAGRWLVNGSGSGILSLRLEPAQRARVMGFPVTLRELMVSVDDPASLQAALHREPTVGA